MVRATLQHPQRGFSLIEAIMVIMITGVLAGLVASFAQPLIGFVGATYRADLSDEADTALQRIGNDLRLASQNTVIVPDSATLLLSLTNGPVLVSYSCDTVAGTLTRCADGACGLLADDVYLCSFGDQLVSQSQWHPDAQIPTLITVQLILTKVDEWISLVRQFCVKCHLN